MIVRRWFAACLSRRQQAGAPDGDRPWLVRHPAPVVVAFPVLVDVFPIQAQQKDPPKDITNSIGMKFVWIPPGSFMMGSPNQEKSRGDDEIHRKVTFTRGLCLGAHTVTQEQWQAVMGANPSNFKSDKNLPVEQVSWDDCQAFCQKLSEQEKKPYRLPTEAEWYLGSA